MIRNRLSLAALTAALLVGGNAQAADSPEVQDAQCMVRASVAQAQLPPQKQAAASNFVFYYMGRLVGRNPKVDIAKQAKEAMVQLSKDKGLVIATRCDKELQVIMDRFHKDAATINAKP